MGWKCAHGSEGLEREIVGPVHKGVHSCPVKVKDEVVVDLVMELREETRMRKCALDHVPRPVAHNLSE